jgi:hypothetical protein
MEEESINDNTMKPNLFQEIIIKEFKLREFIEDLKKEIEIEEERKRIKKQLKDF